MPRVDDRIVAPETRAEYLDGIELFAAPADEPHATKHFDLTYVLGAHVADGYLGAVDMLTRTDEASDFVPDASVFRVPEKIGKRKLEELAFEVSDKQPVRVPTEKARKLIARGVRRVFCINIKHRRLLEWSRETDNWQTIARGSVIEDRCFVRPLPIDALLDAVQADDAVARALLEKDVPVLRKQREADKAEGREEGREEGRTTALIESVLRVFRARGFEMTLSTEQTIRECHDLDQLEQWLEHAATGKSLREVLSVKGRR